MVVLIITMGSLLVEVLHTALEERASRFACKGSLSIDMFTFFDTTPKHWTRQYGYDSIDPGPKLEHGPGYLRA